METAHVSDFQRKGLLLQKGYYLKAGCVNLHPQMFEILRPEWCWSDHGGLELACSYSKALMAFLPERQEISSAPLS